MLQPLNPGREVLEEMYRGRGLSYAEMGTELGVSNQCVMRWMRRAGVESRSRSEARYVALSKYPNSEKQREAASQFSVLARAGITRESYDKMVDTRRKKGVNYSSGPDNHMWRGGIAKTSQRAQWRVRRLECYRRDSWTCQDCGCVCDTPTNGKKIDMKRLVQAHHIVPRRHGGNDDLDNLVTLCRSCHARRENLNLNALFA